MPQQENQQDDDVVMSLVEMALASPTETRDACVRRVCAQDMHLAEAVLNCVRWEQKMGNFLLQPLFSPPAKEDPLKPGEVLENRFRIVREVERGGMGIVYEAVDDKLQRRVALKCAKAEFRKWLPPEVLHATEIAHPNVCKIYEIHTTEAERGEVEYLTMEFLDGETLHARLKKGRLPPDEALKIGQQLCSGLAEAHRKQVIHGDLKSNNVILTRDADGETRAVITDFGLARRPGTTLRAMRSGDVAGTPEYMAPELWKGARPSVASDIYALGVLLHELACGKRPAYTGEGKKLEVPIRYPRWNRALQHCLDPDPERRFQSAEEVGRALAPSRIWVRTAMVATLLAVITGLAVYLYSLQPKESAKLALLPFEYDASTAALPRPLMQDVVAQLKKLKGNTRTKFAFVEPGRRGARVDSTETARKVLGATQVLRVVLTAKDGKTVVHAFVMETNPKVSLKEGKFAYKSGELRYAPVALAGFVTDALHLPPPEAGATVNAAASADYAQAVAKLRRDSTSESAVPLLERAAEADPDSALIYAALAEAQQWKHHHTRDAAWLERANESVRQAQGRNPDLPQVHRIAALLRFREGLYGQALAECTRAIELDPQSADAYRRLGRIYEAENQFDKALTAYQKAVELDPGDYKVYQEIGAFLYMRGEVEQALSYYEKMKVLAPEEPEIHRVLGMDYLLLRRFSEAEVELRQAIQFRETSEIWLALGDVQFAEHKLDEATHSYERAVALPPERFLSWLKLGEVYDAMNRKADSRAAFGRALEIGEGEIARESTNGETRAWLAFACAKLGHKQRAESEIAQALGMSTNDEEVRFYAVATYEALNRRGESLKVLGEATDAEIRYVLNRPELADLSKDARIQQLLAARQIK